jgi:fluoroacetyl-CoA thioesterase
MRKDLKPGLRHERSVLVEENLTVPALAGVFGRGDDMPAVLATAYMVAFIEWTCIDALRPYLENGERTLGVHVDVSHAAATPVGLTVTASVELVALEARRLRFKVSCHDGVDVIGEGYHERALVDRDRFVSRVEKKRTA